MTITAGGPPATRTGGDIAAVRRALLEDAQAEAKQIVAEARHNADETIRQAIDEVDAEVERERHRSELTAQAHADRVLARARNDARGDVLRKQEQLRCELADRARAAALGLREDSRYETLLDRLEAMARDQFDETVTIERDRHLDGGVIASTGSRRVDYTLRAIADRTLDALSDEAVQLWT
jgi:vacuolar-type H+-ATPase subunit E/Vma4